MINKRDFPKEIKILNPRLDIVFKSIFMQDSDDGRIARNSLISSLTGLKIKETEVLNNDIPIELSITEKRIRLDVHCRTDTGERVAVEMQMQSGNYNFPNRLEYYASRLLSGEKRIADDYTNLHRVYQIMICDFTLVKNEEDPLLVNTMKNQFGHPFGDLLNIITLELTKIKLPKMDITKLSDEELELWYKNLTSAEKWGTFFKWADDSKKHERLFALFGDTIGANNAGRILMSLSEIEKAHELAEARLKFVMDYTSDINASRRQGLQEGIEQGLAQGRAESQEEIARLKALLAEHNIPIN